ncbi:TolC family protein [Helicobacter sp. 23-1044]
MKKVIFCAIFALTNLLFNACSATYTAESLKSDFEMGDFRNIYSQNAERTDSLFKVFNDDNLKNLIHSALSQNSDIFIYETRIKSAESQVRLAISKQIPDISASASYSYNGDSTINTNLMASWELDIFGKYASVTDAQYQQLDVAKSNLKYFQISLISDIALAYFNLKYLQNNIVLTKERVINYREMLEIMDFMYKNGLVSFSDFLEKKADMQSEEQSLNTLLNDYEAKKNEIRTLINNRNFVFEDSYITDEVSQDAQKSSYFVIMPQSFDIPNFSVNLNSSANIILNRPDISAQIASLNAAVHNLNSAKAQMYPTLNVSGSLGKAFLQPADFVYNILASLAMPLFSRFEIYENIKISDYTRLEAYYSLQKGVNTAFSEIENAIYSLETNRANLKTSLEILSQNDEVLELLEQSYYAGLIDKAEYLLATNNNLAMIKSSNTAHFNAISAIIYLYRAVGGNDDDIIAKDSPDLSLRGARSEASATKQSTNEQNNTLKLQGK